MSGFTVPVLMINTDGVLKTVCPNLNREKLLFFSDLAKEQLTIGNNNPGHLTKNAVTLPQGAADGKAAARITTFIATNDVKHPKQLTLTDLGIDDFETLVETYAAAYALKLPRPLRGEDLRNAIHEYLHQGALTLSEFAMVVERLAFDGGLVKTAQHTVMHAACKGGRWIPPKFDAIKAYAESAGMWTQMEKIGMEIQSKMEAKNAADARAAAARRAGPKTGAK